jgi:metal-responsive CopG/Arc/MetJ family transcriptional regulator
MGDPDAAPTSRWVHWYNLGYTHVVKTAISIPDEVFQAAEELAGRLGVSRSELYASAVAEYVAALRSRGVTARLNEVYADHSSSLDPALGRAQADAVDSEEW